ncbi:hypothetical protein LOTGIDRAFT_171450 [Lottia gigantea]|uniref:WAP domain-containing protein n=1 Tax=Lottia gigantea TaxID=225164 RepID=V4CM46_LOTGI|nr:hypothetical protein LOTGIDRAFT_171450 [Lottia gigantea]ESP03365.1 hypothetical protein LOTGIDRAFT_171450 [Lottia gigantea]
MKRFTLLALLLVAILYISQSESKCQGVTKCMVNLFTCKREQISVNIAADCCKEYFECFNECKPGSRPPCKNTAPGKRGSWNKRYSSRYGSDILGDIISGY